MNKDQFAKKSYKFGADLYDQIIDDEDNFSENIVFSPFLIHTGLSMIYMGADGDTYEEFGKVLKYGRKGDKNDIAKKYRLILHEMHSESGLKMANHIFVKPNYNLNRAFQNVIANFFNSGVSNVDFNESTAAAEKINKWITDKTNGIIEDLVSPNDFNELTRAVLINTIYFKGVWKRQFHPSITRKMPFWSTPIHFSDVDMMIQHERFKFGNLDKLDATVLEMHYVNSDISMLFFLPNKKDGLKTLEESIHKIDLDFVRNQMRKEYVALFLPKFEFSFTVKLDEILVKLGVKTAFEMFSANFSEMQDPTINEPFWLSRVVHQAFIKVDEKGTEAAAATRLVLCGGGGPPKYYPFNVDHPFMFMLVLNNFVLFAGSVHDPTSN